MVAGVSLSIPVLTAMMTVRDGQAFLAFSALLGLGAATMWPAFMAHVGETTPAPRRASTMSGINLAQMAGIGAGTLAGVLMVDFVTYGAAFWACIAFHVLALAFVLRRRESAPRIEPAEAAAPARAAREGAWAPGIGILALIVLFMTFGTSMHTPMIGAYTRDVLQVKMSYMALLFPAPAAVAAVVLWRLQRHTDRVGRQVPLVGGLLVAACCIFALTLTRSPFIVANLVVLAGLAYAISIPAWGAAALDATDAGSRGLWLGGLSAVQGLGVAGGQALGGLIGGAWGPLAPFQVAAGMLMIALTLILLNQAHHRRSLRAQPALARIER
jgi:MFS family permease